MHSTEAVIHIHWCQPKNMITQNLLSPTSKASLIYCFVGFHLGRKFDFGPEIPRQWVPGLPWMAWHLAEVPSIDSLLTLTSWNPRGHFWGDNKQAPLIFLAAGQVRVVQCVFHTFWVGATSVESSVKVFLKNIPCEWGHLCLPSFLSYPLIPSISDKFFQQLEGGDFEQLLWYHKQSIF